MHANFTYKHQVQVVMASIVVHSYIRRVVRDDETFNKNPKEGGNINEARKEGTRTHCTDVDDLYVAAT